MDPKEARLRLALLSAEVSTLNETYQALSGAQRIGREGKVIRQQITALSRRLREVEKANIRKHLIFKL